MSNLPRSRFGRFFDRAVDFLAYTAGFAIILIILAVSVEVFSRTLFNRPILGVAEIAEYLVLYMAFFGATWVQKMHAHVSMDIIVERLERILEKANKNGYQLAKTPSSLNLSPSEYRKFTFTIENPEDFKKIKSIKIDWVSEEKRY